MDRRIAVQIIGVLAWVGCGPECAPWGAAGAPPPPPPPPPVAQPAPVAPSAAGAAPAAQAPTSVVVGAAVLAPFIGGEYLFPAVVVEDRRDGSAFVAYADGDSSTQPVASLRHDGMSAGTAVEARVEPNGPWWRGEIRQRSHFALFVHFDDGEERWVPTSWVRTSASTGLVMGPPRATSDASHPEALAFGRWADGEWWYPAVITGERPGEKHLVYADGSVGWTPEASVAPDTLTTGARVEVRRGTETTYLPATVLQRIGGVLKVRYDDGAESWTALDRIRIHVTP